jgi:predicted nucleic acid-binding protein
VADAPIAATGLEHDLVVVVRNVDHLERSDVNCLNPFAG